MVFISGYAIIYFIPINNDSHFHLRSKKIQTGDVVFGCIEYHICISSVDYKIINTAIL